MILRKLPDIFTNEIYSSSEHDSCQCFFIYQYLAYCCIFVHLVFVEGPQLGPQGLKPQTPRKEQSIRRKFGLSQTLVDNIMKWKWDPFILWFIPLEVRAKPYS